MNLTEDQKQKVAAWIADGAKLAEIQKRLEGEFKIRLTYLDTRLLVDDLKLVPKSPEPPKEIIPPIPAPTPAAPLGGVAVTVDQIARPGALVSGGVKFSDGQTATWYVDDQGRLGLAPAQAGYKPTPEDVQAFQRALQAEMQKLGM
ncbi:MAG: hypothetical protein RL380_30 [Verrucomicrobiota bacterium]|jgi:hypothetical protein